MQASLLTVYALGLPLPPFFPAIQRDRRTDGAMPALIGVMQVQGSKQRTAIVHSKQELGFV